MKRLLIVALALAFASPALAQNRPKLPFDPLNLEHGGPAVAKLDTEIATFLNNIADFGDAVTLSTSIPGLQDNVGNSCWQQFAPLQALVKVHPIPLTFKLATDIEALRLAAIGLNQVCANPNCGQMFVDASNAANAIAGTQIPVSLGSLCSKVPVIGTAAAAAPTTVTLPVGTTTAPATPATASPSK